jgi:hypothetical protein
MIEKHKLLQRSGTNFASTHSNHSLFNDRDLGREITPFLPIGIWVPLLVVDEMES